MIWAKPMGAVTAPLVFLGLAAFLILFNIFGVESTLAGLLEPGGMLFLSTLNRTARSYVTAKLGAEYLLRLLPTGTHDWKQFITPAELSGLCRGSNLRMADLAGFSFSPLTGKFRIGRDTSSNYIALAEAA